MTHKLHIAVAGLMPVLLKMAMYFDETVGLSLQDGNDRTCSVQDGAQGQGHSSKAFFCTSW